MSSLNVGKGQFYRIIPSGRSSPKNFLERLYALTCEQLDEVVAFVCQYRETPGTSFLELPINFP